MLSLQLKSALFNVKLLAYKLYLVHDILYEKNLHIILLVETWLNSSTGLAAHREAYIKAQNRFISAHYYTFLTTWIVISVYARIVRADLTCYYKSRQINPRYRSENAHQQKEWPGSYWTDQYAGQLWIYKFMYMKQLINIGKILDLVTTELNIDNVSIIDVCFWPSTCALWC